MKRGLIVMAGFTGVMMIAGSQLRAADPDATLIISGEAVTSLAQEQAALKTARRQSEAARQRSLRLEQQAEAAQTQADRARQRGAAIAARIQEAEADITAAQARIAIIERMQDRQAQRLAEKQEPVVRLTAALQMMVRRPLALSLVKPGTLTDTVHMRLVLNEMLPVIRARTASLRTELERSRALRETASHAADALRKAQQQRQDRQLALARIEAEKRAAAQNYGTNAIIESQRALALGERARDIVDLMGKLEQAGDLRARLTALQGPIPRPPQDGEAVQPVNEAKVTQADMEVYRFPVDGTLVTGLGEVSQSGVRSRGLTLVAAGGAQVINPAQGRIVFAGPYRNYGQIVIIDHGQGWMTLLTGLHRTTVKVGEEVEQGSPLGVMGPGRPNISVELRRKGRPVDVLRLSGLG